MQKQSPRKRSVAYPEQTAGLQMRREDMDRFIEEWNGGKDRERTARLYGAALQKFYGWLPVDKTIRADSLDRWLDEMAGDGYSGSTLNYYRAICNRWLKYMGAQGYQKKEKCDPRRSTLLVTTREEYQRMLETAKSMRDEQAFLLIKTFAGTGISIRDLGSLTAEAVGRGEVRTGKRNIHLPPGLCAELMSYADFHGKTEMIFGTRYGNALQEPRISVRLKKVSRAAGLADGKGTARSLQKLYWNTRAELEAAGISDVDKAMDDRFAREQAACGWEV